jgi:flagellar motor switch protein FliN/FliY
MAENKDNNSTEVISPEAKEAPAAEKAKEPEEETSTAEADPSTDADSIKKVELTDLEPAPGEGLKNNLDLLMDVTVPITVELGRSTMKIEEVLQLVSGSVIELDRRADEPVDLKVNGSLVAKGEIVVVEDFFGIRVSEIVDPNEIEP